MADHSGHDSGADFEMNEHERTWHGFLKFIKWLVIGSVVLLAVLLIWRTNG